jgi:hypothetical protein
MLITFPGEYAAVQPNIPSGGGVNWSLPKWMFPMWVGTVAEAVFLIGTERNADKMIGAAYVRSSLLSISPTPIPVFIILAEPSTDSSRHPSFKT